MGSIFCISCGTKNRTPTEACSNCGRLIVPYALTDISNWEQNRTTEEKLDENPELSISQSARKRPALSILCALIVIFCIGFALKFLFSSSPLPKCLEYREFNCSVIVLERKVGFGELARGEFVTVGESSFTRVQAEILDLIRLVALSLDSRSQVSTYSMISNSAKNGRWLAGCSDIKTCSLAKKTGDIDYDGLMGSLGLTRDGSLQRVYFSSTTAAEPTWAFTGMLVFASESSSTQIFDVDEIHIVSDEQSNLELLNKVASAVRSELQSNGINLKVIVSLESHSKSSGKSVARVTVKKGLDELRPFEVAVKLSFSDFSDQDKWSIDLNYSIKHLQAVAAKTAKLVGRAVVFADCSTNPLTPEELVIDNFVVVETICIGSVRYDAIVKESLSSKLEGQILVIGGASESEDLQRIYSEIKKSTEPIFVLRP